MAAAFVSGATAADGASYTTGAGSNLLLVWIPTGFRNGTTTASAQTYDSVSMTEREDLTTDLTGPGDPTANLSDLVAPSADADTIALTWSSALTTETGYAMTLDGVDQSTQLDSSDSAAYAVTNTPSFTINAPANSCIVYFKHHASDAAPGWTVPTGFTEQFADILTASPSHREFRVFTRDVTTALSSFTLGADTTGTAVGGLHGYAIYNEVAAGGTILPQIMQHYN